MTSWRYITPLGVCSALCVLTSKSMALQVKGMAEHRVRGVWAPCYILDREKDSWLLAWLSAGGGGFLMRPRRFYTSTSGRHALHALMSSHEAPPPGVRDPAPPGVKPQSRGLWGVRSIQATAVSKWRRSTCIIASTSELDRSFAPAAWCIGTELWLLY